jgi:hypothetical protein
VGLRPNLNDAPLHFAPESGCSGSNQYSRMTPYELHINLVGGGEEAKHQFIKDKITQQN